MDLILVTDIFGNTPHVADMAEELFPVYANIQVVDPYEGVHPDFGSEQEAYEHFQEACGLEKLTGMTEKAILSGRSRVIAVGFSVGATAVWDLAGRAAVSRNMHRAICFYGSRIREKLHIKPQCETIVIFPRHEDQCDVDAIHDTLCGRNNITCIKTQYLHGFMNPCSRNFQEEGFRTYMNWLKHFAD